MTRKVAVKEVPVGEICTILSWSYPSFPLVTAQIIHHENESYLRRFEVVDNNGFIAFAVGSKHYVGENQQVLMEI